MGCDKIKKELHGTSCQYPLQLFQRLAMDAGEPPPCTCSASVVGGGARNKVGTKDTYVCIPELV